MLSYCIQIALPLMSFSALSHALPNGGGSPGSPWGAGSPTTTYPAPTWTSCPQGQKAVNNITNANFDNLKAPDSNLAVNFIPASDYGVNFQGFDYSTVNGAVDQGTGITIQPGIAPNSGMDYAVASEISQATQGYPTITINFPESNTIAINIERLFYAFSAETDDGFVGVPLAGVLVLTGFRGSDNTATISNQICSRQFIYQPTTVTGLQNMADSGDISGLCPGGVSFYQLTFKEYDEEALSAVLDLLIDSLIIDKWQCVAE